MKTSTVDQLSMVLESLLLTYQFLDSLPLADGWGLVVMLLLLLLLMRIHLDCISALHLFTAGGFFDHRTAVLLRTHRQEVQHEIQFKCKLKRQ